MLEGRRKERTKIQRKTEDAPSKLHRLRTKHLQKKKKEKDLAKSFFFFLNVIDLYYSKKRKPKRKLGISQTSSLFCDHVSFDTL